MNNSDTCGGEFEREFIQNPEHIFKCGEYNIILCSPSVATGKSIEIHSIIAKVYDIFGIVTKK